ncbi:ATP-dependent metallopeptidase FtsH/Yme1/Tma family protein [Sulfurovum sp.]|uniref:ATP-dependent metallopeptidase FtsH/Yme1/Tma family protein n=1 Tax=Sulfurovum sp. TaxID=1969726 RepID=UPI002A366E28|nr:ATP-dependent metallopeptidase FtsH/Yme1/Tma family protein [Sulfurovum sp.]MDY0401936.1 ATP-dependent metallopeptidase FtsH/Yme1/Tma family protein [Sulfurovum sp.]
MKAITQYFNATKHLKIIVSLAAVLALLLAFAMLRDSAEVITHKQANALFTQEKIKKLVVEGEYIRIKTEDKEYKVYEGAINKSSFFSQYPVEVKESNETLYDILMLFMILGAFLLLFKMIRESRAQQLKHLKVNLQKEDETLKAEPVQAITSNVRFSDVAGISAVKEELEEIIDFLKAPQKYKALDISLPKGVLLVGPPGVGKTLISKAVAGEAGVPFFYQSGASFVHIYVGMGAKRVSELFKKAKQMAPSIIFIDEIDAVGKSRGEFRNDEREATLNQLLTEMDGFEESSGVIVIGATNKIDVLDEALLRAGRFDRRIHISLPDLEERAKTLELYLAKKPHSVDIGHIARMSVGFNSAALATLTNEAAIYAMRDGRSTIETSDFEAVKEKVLLGKRKIMSLTDKEREIQAVYQAAKALVATWFDIEFDKIGLVNIMLLREDHEILSKGQLLNRIKVYLAGSVANSIFFKEQFTNASSDIKQAKKMVHQVVYEYMMNENFIITPSAEEELLKNSVAEVTNLLNSLNEALKKTAAYLLEYENIDQEQCREILREIF